MSTVIRPNNQKEDTGRTGRLPPPSPLPEIASAPAWLPKSRRLIRRFAQSGIPAMVDQAVVSGTSFLTTVLVGRWCGADELGLYMLGFSLVVLIISVQQSLINAPYTVYYRRTSPGTRREFAGSVLMHWGCLSLLSSLGLCVGSVIAASGFGPPRLSLVLMVSAAAIPFLLLRDFARGYVYAHLQVRLALVLDVGFSILQVTGLALLAVLGVLNGVTVFAVMGLAGLIATLSWLWFRRHEFAPNWDATRRDWSRSWTLGRWVFAGGTVTSFNSDLFIVWLLALALGKSAAGIFAACMTIVFFSNPFILGLNQVFMPWAAHALAEGGTAQLRRTVYGVSLLVISIMGLFCFGLFFWGEDIMRLVYGDEFLGHHATIVVLGGVVLAGAASLGPSRGLLVLERPQVDLIASVIGLVTTTIASLFLVMMWGVLGAACGLLAGYLAMAMARFILFERQVRLISAANFCDESSALPQAQPTVSVLGATE